MDGLERAINTTPIIDNHAHNLLLPRELAARDFISITSEAEGDAQKATPSSLSHIRAVKQLSEILSCEPDWEVVQAAIAERRKEPGDAWAKECFQGIETVLVDDGLDASTVHPWEWHNALTRSPCKRIVRIEKLAENLLAGIMAQDVKGANFGIESKNILNSWKRGFKDAISKLCQDENVVGFKSVICYRTGLALPTTESAVFLPSDNVIPSPLRSGAIYSPKTFRLEHEYWSPLFVHLAAEILVLHDKPIQFHTGLGDNDITLSLSSPSLMQPFIREYPELKIVLLHASYPFTREAGYLASVYENVYFDIGEVFPMVSQDGQESIIRQSLELCPSEKLCWSTDGHWFPETYILAVVQVRQALTVVLNDNVRKGSLTVQQAIRVVEDVLFNTSNQLYNLNLKIKPPKVASKTTSLRGFSIFLEFLTENPSVKYLRLQWLDMTATPRVRILPIDRAIKLFSANKLSLQSRSVGITKAGLGLLQNDLMTNPFLPVGECKLVPCMESLRLGERNGYATVQGEFWEHNGEQIDICPRSTLRHSTERSEKLGISFLMGFELEVIFMEPIVDAATLKTSYHPLSGSGGHAWSAASALRNPEIMTMAEEIVGSIQRSGIELQQWHPESAPGQFEFITGPLPPLDAVDTLIATREIIFSVAAKYDLRATFVPKPFLNAGGTGAHVHMSLEPASLYPSFYAGILQKLPRIIAYTYSGAESYKRLGDSVWSGGRYVCWGTQNRETPFRKCDDSHWEMKCLDGLANTYLAMAAVLESGLDGIEGKLKLPKECPQDPALLTDEQRAELGITEMLPAGIEEALRLLEKEPVLGGEIEATYIAVKRQELQKLDAMGEEERRTFMIEHY